MTDTSKSDAQAIRDIRERTMAAENSGDADFFDSACAEDVVVMPPNMPGVSGRGAVVAFMREFLGQFDLEIQYVSEETGFHGNLAFDRGTYSQRMTPKAGGAPIPEKGKFLWIYSRNSDGRWEMSRVMWNASEPPPSQ